MGDQILWISWSSANIVYTYHLSHGGECGETFDITHAGLSYAVYAFSAPANSCTEIVLRTIPHILAMFDEN